MCKPIISVCNKQIRPTSRSAAVSKITSRVHTLSTNFGIAAIWAWVDSIADASPELGHVLDNQLWHDGGADGAHLLGLAPG